MKKTRLRTLAAALLVCSLLMSFIPGGAIRASAESEDDWFDIGTDDVITVFSESDDSEPEPQDAYAYESDGDTAAVIDLVSADAPAVDEP